MGQGQPGGTPLTGFLLRAPRHPQNVDHTPHSPMQWRDRLAISACAELWWGQGASSLSQCPEEHGSASPQAGWAPGSSAQGRTLGGASQGGAGCLGASQRLAPSKAKTPLPNRALSRSSSGSTTSWAQGTPCTHRNGDSPVLSSTGLLPVVSDTPNCNLTATLTASAPLPTTVPDLSPLPDPV